MVYDGDGFLGSLGERIRYFRVKRKMTQKKLAELCHITEPAIRNYELGNRTPGDETLHDIADALQVSYYTLADTDCTSLAGIAHALFKIEYGYHFRPIEVDGKTVLSVETDPENAERQIFQMMLDAWLKARRKLESGEWTIDQYHEWMYRYPESFERNRKIGENERTYFL